MSTVAFRLRPDVENPSRDSAPALFLNSLPSSPKVEYQKQTDSAVNVRLQVTDSSGAILFDLDRHLPCYKGLEQLTIASCLSQFMQKVLEAGKNA